VVVRSTRQASNVRRQRALVTVRVR
jgi:hypothetical protein